MSQHRHQLDRYDTNLEVDSINFRVSYLSMPQITESFIIYTSLNAEPIIAGQFTVVFGHTASRSPADFILVKEIKKHLKG